MQFVTNNQNMKIHVKHVVRKDKWRQNFTTAQII